MYQVSQKRLRFLIEILDLIRLEFSRIATRFDLTHRPPRRVRIRGGGDDDDDEDERDAG